MLVEIRSWLGACISNQLSPGLSVLGLYHFKPTFRADKLCLLCSSFVLLDVSHKLACSLGKPSSRKPVTIGKNTVSQTRYKEAASQQLLRQ